MRNEVSMTEGSGRSGELSGFVFRAIGVQSDVLSTGSAA